MDKLRPTSENWDKPQNSNILIDDINNEIIKRWPNNQSDTRLCRQDYKSKSHHIEANQCKHDFVNIDSGVVCQNCRQYFRWPLIFDV